MRYFEPQTATANFYFPNEHGPDVIAELITKENPMTPERLRKIEAFRLSGYKVLVWHEEDFNTFEKYDETMLNLRHQLGMPDDPDMEKYKEERRRVYREMFGETY